VANDRIYRITSLGRPLDPAYRTNRAVLLILPVAGAGATILAGVRGAGLLDALVAGVVGVAVALGSWALARELAPDDNRAAFLSLALAYATLLWVGSPSLLLLFTALFFVRMINRSTGLPARLGDSIAVTGLTLWTMHATRSPLLAVVAALAFAFDAGLSRPLRRQWFFAVLCLDGAAIWTFVVGRGLDELVRLDPGASYWPAAVAVVYGIAYFRTRAVTSLGDVGGERLSRARVRAGMAIGLLVPAVSGPVELSSAVWATLAGVGLSSAIGLARGLRSR
jgi:hypothetical protein